MLTWWWKIRPERLVKALNARIRLGVGWWFSSCALWSLLGSLEVTQGLMKDGQEEAAIASFILLQPS